MANGITRIDVAATAVVMLLGACVLGAGGFGGGPDKAFVISIANLERIGRATGTYQHDWNGYLPIVGAYQGRRANAGGTNIVGFCAWTAMGKNSSAYWYTTFSGIFDIEAADRPLNPYVLPGVTWPAPTPPAQLPPTDPARRQEAVVYRDPSNKFTYQRAWPNVTQTIATYDDVGTGYLWSLAWWEQSNAILPGGTFAAKFNEGTRRLSVSQGLSPSAFVWCHDYVTDVLPFGSNPNQVLVNGYGDANKSLMLFYDGHAEYEDVIPGYRRTSFINDKYSLIFSDLPNPGGP